jgi:putative ABC transport system ATP-binding protein
MMSVLELAGLRKTYRAGTQAVEALRGVDLSVEKGEFLAIVGPSGSGKTTLLNIVGCLDLPTSGKVVYEGKELHALKENELAEYRKSRISFIFQSYNLIPVLTIQENVELPIVIERKLSRAETAAKAREMIQAVGLGGMEKRYPREISGGQEQRVAIARALVKDPILVLADEPTANLDSVTATEIVSIMQDINAKRGVTFIFSTHDRLVQEKARRIVTIRDGQVHADERKA